MFLNKFDISQKVGWITTDNASSNDTMCDELEKNLNNFNFLENHVRCFCHVINLVVICLIKGFKNQEETVPEEPVEETVAKPKRRLSVRSSRNALNQYVCFLLFLILIYLQLNFVE